LCSGDYVNDKTLEDQHSKLLSELKVQVNDAFPSHDVITDDFINTLSDSLKVELGKYRKQNSKKFGGFFLKRALIGGLILGTTGAVAAPVGVLALTTEAGLGAAAAMGIGAGGGMGLGAVVNGIRAWFH